MVIDNMIALMRSGFLEVKDNRRDNLTYSMSNLLNLAFAMFSLKDSSLSAFRKQFDVRAENLSRIYGVTELPRDTALREGIDEVLPDDLQRLFKPALDFLDSEGVTCQRRVLGKYTAVSVHGTGHYCSSKKGCHNVW